jgi:hypothetical protein
VIEVVPSSTSCSNPPNLRHLLALIPQSLLQSYRSRGYLQDYPAFITTAARTVSIGTSSKWTKIRQSAKVIVCWQRTQEQTLIRPSSLLHHRQEDDLRHGFPRIRQGAGVAAGIRDIWFVKYTDCADSILIPCLWNRGHHRDLDTNGSAKP